MQRSRWRVWLSWVLKSISINFIESVWAVWAGASYVLSLAASNMARFCSLVLLLAPDDSAEEKSGVFLRNCPVTDSKPRPLWAGAGHLQIHPWHIGDVHQRVDDEKLREVGGSLGTRTGWNWWVVGRSGPEKSENGSSLVLKWHELITHCRWIILNHIAMASLPKWSYGFLTLEASGINIDLHMLSSGHYIEKIHDSLMMPDAISWSLPQKSQSYCY